MFSRVLTSVSVCCVAPRRATAPPRTTTPCRHSRLPARRCELPPRVLRKWPMWGLLLHQRPRRAMRVDGRCFGRLLWAPGRPFGGPKKKPLKLRGHFWADFRAHTRTLHKMAPGTPGPFLCTRMHPKEQLFSWSQKLSMHGGLSRIF